VGFHPVGVVIGNSSTHIARPLTLGAGNRLNTFSRSFSGDVGDVLPPAILRAQGGGGGGGGDEGGGGGEGSGGGGGEGSGGGGGEGSGGGGGEGSGGGGPPFLAAYRCPHVVNRPSLRGRRLSDHFPGYNWELPQLGGSFTECFNNALSRLIARAIARAAHGVVDIRIDISGDQMLQGNVGVTLTGTAIASPSTPPLERPFTAGISCQAFAKLVTRGIIPVQLTMGAVVLSSWIGCQTRSELESGYSKSVVQLGDALTQARDRATALMWQQTRLTDAPFVEVTVRHARRKATKSDYRVAAWSSGTVVQRFAPASTGDPAMVVMQMEQR
jgi:uncharacterized protein YbjQ (UPF0145 family)